MGVPGEFEGEDMGRKFKSMDGNEAAAHVSYAFTEVAGIYPITPSSPMADHVDQWAAQGRKNIFGTPVNVVEMESEAGAAGTVHGSLGAGALTTTYTASQGLLLMIPNMYKIAGEGLPGVFHVSARTVASHALNIFGDHSDVMACRQTGFAMLAEGNVQEVMDLSPVAHLAAIEGKVPFLNFFDGFRTSHEIQKVAVWDYEDLKDMCDMDAVQAFRDHALNPEHPHARGSHENGDIFFQHREACNKAYDELPAVVEKYMGKINEKLGTDYGLFNYYGAPDADRVVVCMGSFCDVLEEVIDYLNAHGEKVGLVKVRLFRPFSIERFVDVIPATVQKIAVMDRTKEPGSIGEPLYQDVVSALYEAGKTGIKVVGGRYGLGSKDTPPASAFAVFEELKKDEPKREFTIGIVDDVTNLSLPEAEETPNTAAPGTIECKFWGLGGDGTVGANKNSIKIIGDHTDMYAQAYFAYDSKKSGGLTVSHLRFGKTPIQSPYQIDAADFTACHNPAYVTQYDMLSTLKDGGTFLLNCQWSDEELEEHLPASMKQQLAKKHVKFYAIDAIDLAAKVGMGNRINTIMQAAFFKLADVIPYAQADEYMKAYAKKTYGKKGDAVVQKNWDAIDIAISGLREVKVPEAWATATTGAVPMQVKGDEYYNNFVKPILAQEGDKLPVSAIAADGVVPTGTTKYEKRGIAVKVPAWDVTKCVQCNLCSLVCPHAAIRPYLVDEGTAPETFVTKKALGKQFAGKAFRIQVSPLDCTGCGNCVDVCLGKCLTMEPLADQMKEEANWEYAQTIPEVDSTLINKANVKESQFLKPLFEFSGACAGCGETPYVKLVTQLFGDRMMVANATGCSSIYGGSAPTVPYTKNDKGQGPAWANSLFEDNAEFGFGMNLATTQRRAKLAELVTELAGQVEGEAKETCEAWLAAMNDGEASKAASAKLAALVEGCDSDLCKEIASMKDMMIKKSQWIFGGDGWAYDIGYGGVDHVLAQGEDVNILVLDTEVYSNTGGQASKSTPTGSIAKFAASGKKTRKKDLGMMAMSYGYVYVATVAMSANPAQLLKAMNEAEAYHGPSLVIAYAPCINHGINMAHAQMEIKRAVACGYWPLYRYNPELADQGKNPLIVDSKDPTESYQDFIRGEVRYASLAKLFPAKAEEAYKINEEDAKRRLETYKKLAAE